MYLFLGGAAAISGFVLTLVLVVLCFVHPMAIIGVAIWFGFLLHCYRYYRAKHRAAMRLEAAKRAALLPTRTSLD